MLLLAAIWFPHPASTGKPQGNFKPLCDLQHLNREYVRELSYRRRALFPHAAAAQFDQRLLYGTVLHNRRMELSDSLFHDADTFHAELAGTISEARKYTNSPRQLAQYLWLRLDASPAHAAIQRDTSLCFVSVSCSQNFFVVRLSKQASKLHVDEQQQYTRWLKEAAAQ